MEPLWESRTDHMIMYQLAQKLGFDKELVKNYKMQKVKGMDEPVTEDILREINRSNWTIGYTGQSPERLKAHMRNMNVFDVKTLRAKAGSTRRPATSSTATTSGCRGRATARRNSSTRARRTCT
jgi:formate dehydrogenase major subunit